MRCFNCHKNFDYDKYYGICPKCGCFNQRETQEERHEDLHDRFGDDSDHREAREHDQPHSFSSYPNVSRETFGDAQSSGSIPVYEQEKTKRRGSGFLAVSIAVLILGLAFLISGSLVHTIGNSPSGTEDNSLQFLSHEAGEDFVFQQGSLKVAEAKRLADQNSLPGLLEGMTLIAVHVTGQSDGEYEYYNKVAVPYLEIDGTYRRAFQPTILNRMGSCWMHIRFWMSMPSWREMPVMAGMVFWQRMTSRIFESGLMNTMEVIGMAASFWRRTMWIW